MPGTKSKCVMPSSPVPVYSLLGYVGVGCTHHVEKNGGAHLTLSTDTAAELSLCNWVMETLDMSIFIAKNKQF